MTLIGNYIHYLTYQLNAINAQNYLTIHEHYFEFLTERLSVCNPFNIKTLLLLMKVYNENINLKKRPRSHIAYLSNISRNSYQNSVYLSKQLSKVKYKFFSPCCFSSCCVSHVWLYYFHFWIQFFVHVHAFGDLDLNFDLTFSTQKYLNSNKMLTMKWIQMVRI